MTLYIDRLFLSDTSFYYTNLLKMSNSLILKDFSVNRIEVIYSNRFNTPAPSEMLLFPIINENLLYDVYVPLFLVRPFHVFDPIHA